MTQSRQYYFNKINRLYLAQLLYQVLQGEVFMIDLILHLLCLGAVIFMVARTLPGIYVDSYGTCVMVAIVYGLINITLGTLLKLLGLPFIIITLGLFLIIINTFLLWLTDLLLEDFEIEDIGTTFVAALLITFADTILGLIF